MYKALIFDFDGVIIDSEPIHEKAWNIFFKQYSLQFTEEMKHGFKGRSTKDNMREMWGGTFDTDTLAARIKERQELFLELLLEHIPLVPGIQLFLARAKKDGYAIGLATSTTSKRVRAVFDRVDIGHMFDTVVTADDVHHAKPDPEIYQMSANRLGVAPEECIVFEDAPNGILAARAARMKTVFVATTYDPQSIPEKDYIVYDFHGVSAAEIIRSIKRG